MSEAARAFAYRARACAHAALGHTTSALADADESIRLAPDAAWSYVVRGETHVLAEAWERAVADLTRALELDPQASFGFRVHRARGHARLHAGDDAGALEDLRVAARRSLRDPSLFVTRAQAHVALGELAAAQDDLDWALWLDPNHAAARNWRGGVRLTRGQTGGLDDLRRAAELEGERATTYALLLAAALTGDGRGLQAVPADDAWPHPLAHYFRGDLTARELLARAAVADDDTQRNHQLARAHGLLGIQADRAGDEEAALAHFDACIATGARTGETIWARGRLAADADATRPRTP